MIAVEKGIAVHVLNFIIWRAPIPFPGRDKEPPFDVAAIRKFVSDRLIHTADEVESEQLEIKGWCGDDRELADKVAEACACLANTSGDYVLVGVADGPRLGRKFSSCQWPQRAKTYHPLSLKLHRIPEFPVVWLLDSKGMPRRILIANDNRMVRQTVAEMLRGGFVVCGEAVDGQDAVAKKLSNSSPI